MLTRDKNGWTEFAGLDIDGRNGIWVDIGGLED